MADHRRIERCFAPDGSANSGPRPPPPPPPPPHLHHCRHLTVVGHDARWSASPSPSRPPPPRRRLAPRRRPTPPAVAPRRHPPPLAGSAGPRGREPIAAGRAHRARSIGRASHLTPITKSRWAQFGPGLQCDSRDVGTSGGPSQNRAHPVAPDSAHEAPAVTVAARRSATERPADMFRSAGSLGGDRRSRSRSLRGHASKARSRVERAVPVRTGCRRLSLIQGQPRRAFDRPNTATSSDAREPARSGGDHER